MVVISGEGVTTYRPFSGETVVPKLCIFEQTDLARPDSELYGKEVHATRRRMGELLADAVPLPQSDSYFDRPTMVVGVPGSGESAAEGFALQSGIPLGHAFVRNGAGRAVLIEPEYTSSAAVQRDFSPLSETVRGKRIVLIDTSLALGVKTRALVSMLRVAQAVEVHLRFSSPPVKWPCFYGVRMGSGADLLAPNLDLDEMRRYLGGDSLGFLSIENVKNAVAAPGAGFCDGCFTGDYPTEVPVSIRRNADDTRVNQF